MRVEASFLFSFLKWRRSGVHIIECMVEEGAQRCVQSSVEVSDSNVVCSLVTRSVINDLRNTSLL